MRKSRRRGRRRCAAPARRSTGSTTGSPSGCGPGAPSARSARDIADAILAEGHVRVDFVIVGSGPNGASPHHELSDRVIESGDPVVVDIGGTMPAGYCSDSTRTYASGSRPREFRELLRRAAGRAAGGVRRTSGPASPRETVDAAARDVIAAAGYGEHFIHRTGHGIGLETHEEPYIVAGNTELLEPGMAFSHRAGHLPCRAARRPHRGHRRVQRVRRRAREPHLARAGGALMASMVERLLPSDEARDLLELTREIADAELAPAVTAAEHERRRSRGRRCARWGSRVCSRCPTPRSSAAADSRTRSTCRCSRRSRTRGSRSVSACQRALAGVLPAGDVRHREQQAALAAGHARRRAARRVLPVRAAVGLRRRGAATRAAARRRRLRGLRHEGLDHARRAGGLLRPHGAHRRTRVPRGISCLLAPGEHAGLSVGAPERKMGAKASRTAQVVLDGARIPRERLIGEEGKGFSIALAALDSGRLGIAACAVGLAQAALDTAAAYAKERQQFGRPIGDVPGDPVHARGHGDGSRPRPGRCTWRPRGAGRRARRSPSRRPRPSCSPPTPPCG